ncbi:hypothetical protein C8R44DRAFT_252605 [Mycena epipterygia]|nr:hypothetical protein C8R44DRAFT_252605 [Mycena epipterygia]
MGDEEPQSARSAGSSSDWQQSDPPDFTSPKQERQLYRQFMSNFSRPADRPAFTTLQPIHVVSNPLEIFRHDVPTRRRFLHCPKRTIWCFGERLHALIFAPTHEYWHRSNGWANKSKIDSFVGQKVDFFINQNGYVYYVGTYAVHSMRSVHPPGAKITSDVSQTAIYHATGLGQHEREKVRQCFPDGEIRTECFGLQCVGFDHQLYDRLRERFKSGGDGTNKRKAGTEDLRDDARAKTQRVY